MSCERIWLLFLSVEVTVYLTVTASNSDILTDVSSENLENKRFYRYLCSQLFLLSSCKIGQHERHYARRNHRQKLEKWFLSGMYCVRCSISPSTDEKNRTANRGGKKQTSAWTRMGGKPIPGFVDGSLVICIASAFILYFLRCCRWGWLDSWIEACVCINCKASQ